MFRHGGDESNLHIIGNTFVNIRINSHTLHFHHSDWFQIVRDC